MSMGGQVTEFAQVQTHEGKDPIQNERNSKTYSALNRLQGISFVSLNHLSLPIK